MPATTPKQKITQVKMFGEDYIKVILSGDTYDTCQKIALSHQRDKKNIYSSF